MCACFCLTHKTTHTSLCEALFCCSENISGSLFAREANVHNASLLDMNQGPNPEIHMLVCLVSTVLWELLSKWSHKSCLVWFQVEQNCLYSKKSRFSTSSLYGKPLDLGVPIVFVQQNFRWTRSRGALLAESSSGKTTSPEKVCEHWGSGELRWVQMPHMPLPKMASRAIFSSCWHTPIKTSRNWILVAMAGEDVSSQPVELLKNC